MFKTLLEDIESIRLRDPTLNSFFNVIDEKKAMDELWNLAGKPPRD
jgi:hypothetical protein